MFGQEDISQTIEYKKAKLLLHTFVFSYAGLDADEQKMLNELAAAEEVQNELKWALEFVHSDLFSAFSRVSNYLSEYLSGKTPKIKLGLLLTAFESAQRKGNVSEFEALSLLKLAKILGIEAEFVNKIRKN